MNIGILFLHPPGESMGSIYRIWNFCQGLTKMSHRCFVFTPFNYSGSEDWGPLVNFITFSIVKSKGTFLNLIYKLARKILDIRIISNFTTLNPTFFNLTINQLSKTLLSKIKEQSIPLDVIIGETEIGGLVLTRIKNKLNIPIIVDYQNFWPQELVEHRVIKRNSRRYKFLVDMERFVINNADLVITISKALKDYLLKNCNPKKKLKIKTINNGGYPFLNRPKIKEFPPKIINSGMVVHRSNFNLFLQSIPYVLKKYPDTRVYITRKGEKLKETIKLAKKMNLNVNFYWKDTNKEYLELLSECHVGIVTSTNELSRKLGFVAKIYDYCSVGIPIVGNNIGGWSSIISKEKVGLLSSNNPKDLADKIIQFIGNPDMSYEYGMRGIKLLEEKHSIRFSSEKLIKNIEKIL